MTERHRFVHQGEPHWFELEVRGDRHWYRVWKLNPERSPPSDDSSPDRYVTLGAIGWWVDTYEAEGPDGRPIDRDSALAKALLLALDDADDAHPEWFGGVW